VLVTQKAKTSSLLAQFCAILLVGLMSLSANAEENMNPRVYISGYSPTISCYTLDMATGELKPLSTSEGGKNPSFLAWSPDKKFLYSCLEAGDGAIAAFSINPKDGSLTKINEASSAGKGPCHVSVHPSGKFVFSANYGSGHVGALPVGANGGVGAPIENILAGKNAHQIVPDPSGKFVFVPCLGSNYVAQYTIDGAGAMKLNTPPNVALPEKAGPRHFAIHPNYKYAYVINEQGLTMTSFKYDAEKGLLSDPETLPTVPPDTDPKGKSTAHVVVSPDGKFVYGSNRGHDTIVIYKVGDNGRLTLVGHENGGGDVKTPRNFTIDPTGKFVLVANQKGNSVTVFKRDAEKGTLTKVGTTAVTTGPSFVGVMP
jgi:6-phosphogluconolactonase